jgi:hypothetical protein
MNALQLTYGHFRINRGGAQIGVPKHLLDVPDIGSVFEHEGGATVAEDVATARLDPGAAHVIGTSERQKFTARAATLQVDIAAFFRPDDDLGDSNNQAHAIKELNLRFQQRRQEAEAAASSSLPPIPGHAAALDKFTKSLHSSSSSSSPLDQRTISH